MENSLEVKFITETGFALRYMGFEVLIDAGFIPKSISQSPKKSLDLQSENLFLPTSQVSEDSEIFNPDVVLYSQIGNHHSTFAEVNHWFSGDKKTKFVFPAVAQELQETIVNQFHSSNLEKPELLFFFDSDELIVGPFKIVGHMHPIEFHLIWQITVEDINFIHMSEIPHNRRKGDQRLDILFEKFENSRPHFCFIGARGNSKRSEKDGIKFIEDNITATPIQAARLIKTVNPTCCGIMGKFVLFDPETGNESDFPKHLFDQQFRWALQHVQPEIRVITLQPNFRMYARVRSKEREIYARI